MWNYASSQMPFNFPLSFCLFSCPITIMKSIITGISPQYWLKCPDKSAERNSETHMVRVKIGTPCSGTGKLSIFLVISNGICKIIRVSYSGRNSEHWPKWCSTADRPSQLRQLRMRVFVRVLSESLQSVLFIACDRWRDCLDPSSDVLNCGSWV